MFFREEGEIYGPIEVEIKQKEEFAQNFSEERGLEQEKLGKR